MSRFRPSGLLDWTFEIAVIFKGIDGVLEIIGGILLLVTSKETLAGWLTTLTQHELSEDPHDFLFTHLLSSANHVLNSSLTFAALYLVAHGVVKLVLVVAVLRDQMWAYPWMIGFLVVFIAYQSYLMVLRPTWGIALLTLFDVFVVWLTYREFVKHRRRLATGAPRRTPRTP